MSNRKIFIFGLIAFLSMIFSASFLSSYDVFAAQVPDIIVKELTQRCTKGNYYEKTWEGTWKHFYEYSGLNKSMTTNWISLDPGGQQVVSSLAHKVRTTFSKGQVFYVNYAFMACPGLGGSDKFMSNVKIVKNKDSDKLETDLVADYGAGKILQYHKISPGSVVRLRYYPVKIKNSAYDSMREGVNRISFDTRNCVTNLSLTKLEKNGKRVLVDKWPYINKPREVEEAAEGTPEYDLCIKVDSSIEVNIVKPKKWQTEIRSYIQSTERDSEFSDSRWGQPSREIKVNVGNKVYFKHTLKNIGDVTNDKISNIVVRAEGRDFYDKGNTEYQVHGNSVSRGAGIFAEASPRNSRQMNNSYLTYTVRPKDVGKKICMRIEIVPAVKNRDHIRNAYQNANSDHNIGYSQKACAYVSYDYKNIPNTKIPQSAGSCADQDSCHGEYENGTENIKFSSSVQTPKSGVPIRPINWKVSYFVVKPNQKIPGTATVNDNIFGTSKSIDNGGYIDYNENSDPCSPSFYNKNGVVYKSSEADISRKIEGCKVINSGTIASASGKVDLTVPIFGKNNIFDIPNNAEVGTKYCFAVSVSPYRIDSKWTEEQQKKFNGWHHGKPGCIIVVKKPKAQVLGGGLYANLGVFGETTVNNGRMYGSWVEYDIVTNGHNSKVASNGVFGTPDLTNGRTSSESLRNRLTFANDGSYGKFSKAFSVKNFVKKMENIFSSRQANYIGNNVNIERSSRDYIVKPTGDITISSISIETGDVVIFAPNRTVRINGDINQVSGNRRLNQVSQAIIIAKNVEISENVRRVDAWILAENLNTCYNAVIRNDRCNKSLEINGITALYGKDKQSLKLNRTAGSVGVGDAISSPGEIFRMTPDAYQWILNQSNKSDAKITTTYSRELPIRY